MHRNPHQSVTRPRPHRYDFWNVNITVLSHLRWINKRIVHTLLISKPYPTITLISNLTKSKLGQYTEQAMDPCCIGFTIISRPVAFSLSKHTHILHALLLARQSQSKLHGWAHMLISSALCTEEPLVHRHLLSQDRQNEELHNANKNLPSTSDVSRVTFAALRLPAGRFKPILSNFSLKDLPPFLDLALWSKHTK